MKFLRKFRKAIACCSGFFALFFGLSVHAQAANVTVGDALSYPNGYNHMTHYFYLDGQLTYCLQPRLGPMQNGEYDTMIISDEGSDGYPLLVKVLACGYGGPNDLTTVYFPGASEQERYVYTHIAAGYAYMSNAEMSDCYDMTGLTNDQFEACGLGDFVRAAWSTSYRGTIKIVRVDGAQDVGYLASYYIDEPPKDYMLYINKTDMQNRALAGAVFEAYSDENCMNSLGVLNETDSSGNSSLQISHQYDTIYVKEIRPPYGFVKDEQVYMFTGGEDAYLYAKNEESKGRIEIFKKDSQTWDNTSGDATLGGAIYGIYANDNILSPSDYSVVFEKDSLVSTVTTDASGYGISEELMLGTYKIKEIQPPTGYALNGNESTVTLQYDKGVQRVYVERVVVTDDICKGFFEIDKIKGNNREEKVKGAGFSAYLKSALPVKANGEYDFENAIPVALTDNGDTIIYTDENGYAKSTLLPYGTYVVREVYVPKNYKKCEDFEVTIAVNDACNPSQTATVSDDSFRIKFRINKIDKESQNFIRPASDDEVLFNVYDLTRGKYVDKNLKLTSDGFLKTDKLYEAGDYRIEEIDAPNGYVLNENFVTVSIDDETTSKTDEENEKVIEVNIENEKYLGEIKIVKLGEKLSNVSKGSEEKNSNAKFAYEYKPLEGAEFTLYAAENIYYPDGRKDKDGKRSILYKKDEAIGTKTTGSDGTAVFGKDDYELCFGDYYVKETKAPEGYLKSDEKYDFSLKNNDKNEKYIKFQKEIKDKRQKLGITVVKKDKTEETFLKGIAFSLYADADIKDESGKVLAKSGDFLCKTTTDANGTGKFDIDLCEGKYKITESTSLNGYKQNNSPTLITLSNDENCIKNEKITEVVIDNESYLGEISIVKTGECLKDVAGQDEERGEDAKFIYEAMPLCNVEFALYAAEDINYPDQRTDKNGKLKVMYKKDEEIGRELTNENGIANFGSDKYTLYYGDYYILETKAVEGFVKSDEKIKVSIKDNKENKSTVVVSKEAYNERQKASVSVIKKDLNDSSLLAGAEFSLYAEEDIEDKNGKTLVKKGEYLGKTITDEEGIGKFNLDLTNGKYAIVETKAPDGYLVNEERTVFEINFDDTGEEIVKTFEVCDEKKPAPKAQTGSVVKGATKKKVTKNNYRTDDLGTDGYSITLKKEDKPVWLYLSLGAAMILAGILTISVSVFSSFGGKRNG